MMKKSVTSCPLVIVNHLFPPGCLSTNPLRSQSLFSTIQQLEVQHPHSWVSLIFFSYSQIAVFPFKPLVGSPFRSSLGAIISIIINKYQKIKTESIDFSENSCLLTLVIIFYRHYFNHQQCYKMNQKTLQGIYKSFETQEFYRRYLVELGCREDRRKIDEQRSIKVTSKNNSVVLSCGQTIVIAHIEASIVPVTFSPVSNSYGQPLLQIKVSNSNNTQKYSKESKSDKAIEHYIEKKIEWGSIQDQLAGSDLITGKQYAYKGQIVVRVLGDDGGIQEYSLLAVELLLLTCLFKKFAVNKQKIELKEDYMLLVKSIIYPFKYCEILQKIIVDPSLTQIQNADLVVTVLKDLKNVENPPTVIQRVKKNKDISGQSNLINIMKRWELDINKLRANFEQRLEQLKTNYQCILN